MLRVLALILSMMAFASSCAFAQINTVVSIEVLVSPLGSPEVRYQHLTYGSGVVITSRGDVLTARHVVEFKLAEVGPDRRYVLRLNDRNFGPYEANLVSCANGEIDICILRLARSSSLGASNIHQPARLLCREARHDDKLHFFGFGADVNEGVQSPSGEVSGGLSGTGKYPVSGAGIRPGMSGGPVVDADGYVIGLTTGVDEETGNSAYLQTLFYQFGLPRDVDCSDQGVPPGSWFPENASENIKSDAELLGIASGEGTSPEISGSLVIGNLAAAQAQLEDEKARLREQEQAFRDGARQMVEELTASGVEFGGINNPAKRWRQRSISFCFFDGDAALRQQVADIGALWTHWGDLHFDFGDGTPRTCDPAEYSDVRISLNGRGTNSSKIGSDSKMGSQTVPSMQLSQVGAGTGFPRTILHEFGHMLGLGHVLAHPDFCRDELNLEAIYSRYEAMGMSRHQIEQQIFPPPPRNSEIGALDVKSVMNYNFPAEFYLRGKESRCYSGDVMGLSLLDKLAMFHMYPFGSEEDGTGGSDGVPESTDEATDLGTFQPL